MFALARNTRFILFALARSWKPCSLLARNPRFILFLEVFRKNIQDLSSSSWQDLGNLVRLGKKSKIYLLLLGKEILFGNLVRLGKKVQDLSCSPWQDLGNLVRIRKKFKIYLLRALARSWKSCSPWQEVLEILFVLARKSKIYLVRLGKVLDSLVRLGIKSKIYLLRLGKVLEILFALA